MASILPDHEIKKLIGIVLIGAEEEFLNPNGIELRLGNNVRFLLTEEEKKLSEGKILKVVPGESVIITSLEKIDFSTDKVNSIYPNCTLMGLITPTTTMMREGISQAATKIDAGFRGVLNWGLRNGSIKDLILEYGQPIFKLTIFKLDKNESPEIPYGQRNADKYQDTIGIERSRRHIRADLRKQDIISSSQEKIDPKKQLREAGYPFNHIGTELVELHGKFETVSRDVALLKNQITESTQKLSNKFSDETNAITKKLEEFRHNLIESVNTIFEKKFYRITGVLIGAIAILYGGVNFLQEKNIGGDLLTLIACIVGIVIILIVSLVSRRS